MSEKGMFASVQCYNVKNIQALASAREHAFRRDENSRERVDASRTHLNLVASQYGEDGRDVVDCFKQFKAETGIKEQKSASVALHLLCIVSPEWLQETGDPRDPDNPRVKELFCESQKWAEQTFGPGSVIASRLDVDESGSGVVDVFVCPSSVVKQKNRDDRHVISTRKALKNIQREYKSLAPSWLFRTVLRNMLKSISIAGCKEAYRNRKANANTFTQTYIGQPYKKRSKSENLRRAKLCKFVAMQSNKLSR